MKKYFSGLLLIIINLSFFFHQYKYTTFSSAFPLPLCVWIWFDNVDEKKTARSFRSFNPNNEKKITRKKYYIINVVSAFHQETRITNQKKKISRCVWTPPPPPPLPLNYHIVFDYHVLSFFSDEWIFHHFYFYFLQFKSEIFTRLFCWSQNQSQK